MKQTQLLHLHTHALFKCSTCVEFFFGSSCRDPLWYEGLSPPLERVVSLGAVWGETACGYCEASVVQSDQWPHSRRQGISEQIFIIYLCDSVQGKFVLIWFNRLDFL